MCLPVGWRCAACLGLPPACDWFCWVSIWTDEHGALVVLSVCTAALHYCLKPGLPALVLRYIICLAVHTLNVFLVTLRGCKLSCPKTDQEGLTEREHVLLQHDFVQSGPALCMHHITKDLFAVWSSSCCYYSVYAHRQLPTGRLEHCNGSHE